MADASIDLSAHLDDLAAAAKAKGLSATAVQDYAAQHGITLEAAAKLVLGSSTLSTIQDIARRVGTTINKLENVGADVSTGATAGAAIGSIVPGVGTAIGGAVGTVAGAIYGVIDQFGGDIADFASGLFGGGPDPVCLDFFRQPGSCDNIDLRMNNVVRAQRALRAHPDDLLPLTPAVFADGYVSSAAMGEPRAGYQLDIAYADRLLTLERMRMAHLSENERMADHVLHANPRAILGQVPLFGVTFTGPDVIAKKFGVPPAFADQMVSAAAKLVKAAPPPAPKPANPNAPKLLQIGSKSTAAIAASVAALPTPTADDWVGFYLGGGTEGRIARPVVPAVAKAAQLLAASPLAASLLGSLAKNLSTLPKGK